MTPSVCELRRRFVGAGHRCEDGGIIVRIGDLQVVVAPKVMNETRKSRERPSLAKLAVLAYAGLAYLAFVLAFAWLLAFLLGVGPVRGIDDPAGGAGASAVIVDVGLLLVFALQHTIMARPGFKRLLTKLLPAAAERSTYVLASALALMLMVWQWRGIDALLWDLDAEPLRLGVLALSLTAWIGAALTTFIHDHLEFFGLRQARDHLRGLSTPAAGLREVSAYRIVRHPMMALMLIGLWSTPTMSAGHLLFALGMTAYIAVGVQFEERSLRRAFGSSYADYQRRVPMLVPRLWPRGE